MISGKHINKITAVAVCLALLFCTFIVYAANAYDTSNTPEYEKRLFNGEVVTIDIQVDDDVWQGLIDNATSKEFISANVVINGEIFSTVGVRTKGNSSLTQASSSSTARYSLQFSMNHYVKGQTYYGLDKFCINNMMGDATYMKDYISYDIMRYIGVPTALSGYASVTVNGEDYGFFVLLERYNESFLDREYNTSGGNLYSVKIQMGMRDNFEQGNVQEDRANRTMGGFGGSGGGSLIYTDDEISSYSSIFDNAVFSKTTESDNKRVITAIKNLNEGTNLEQYWDVDEILRYFAAHTVVVNLDSYISNMQQNYYIYEKDGKISILPWDYGLAFGGYQSGDATDIVNFAIDTPVSGVSMEDRPLLNMLLEVEEYKEKYHEYLREIVDGYFFSGLFEETVRQLDDKINEYVENDVSAYFTHEQYEEAVSSLIELGMLRDESISGQLDGTIPSTTSGQKEDSSTLIDASHISLSTLGTMGGGGGFGGGGNMRGNMGGFGGQRSNTSGQNNQDVSSQLTDTSGEVNQELSGQPPDMSGGMNQDMSGQPPDMAGGINRDMTGQMPDMSSEMSQDMASQALDATGGSQAFDTAVETEQDMAGQMPSMFGFNNMESFDMETMQGAMEIVSSTSDEGLTDEQTEQLRELGLSDDDIDQLAQMIQSFSGLFGQGENGEQGDRMRSFFGQSQSSQVNEPLTYEDWIFYGILLLVLIGSTLFIALYQRRKMQPGVS